MNATAVIEPKKNYKIIDKIILDGQNVPVVEFEKKSHSDLTDKASRMTKVFAMPQKDYWQDQLSANRELALNGFYIYWYNKTGRTLKIIYGSGCDFITKNSKRFGNYSLIKNEMFEMAKSTKFIKIK